MRLGRGIPSIKRESPCCQELFSRWPLRVIHLPSGIGKNLLAPALFGKWNLDEDSAVKPSSIPKLGWPEQPKKAFAFCLITLDSLP